MNVIHIGTLLRIDLPSDVFEAIDDAVTAAMWDQLSSGGSVTHVDITPLDGVSATQTFPTGSPAKWTGGSGGVIAPAVSILIKLQTGVRGRANRGRIFLPFMVGAAADNGFLAPAEVTSMSAAWMEFRTTLAGDADTSDTIGVASYDRKHAGAGAHYTPASVLSAESALGTQRRRQQRNR